MQRTKFENEQTYIFDITSFPRFYFGFAGGGGAYDHACVGLKYIEDIKVK